MANDSSQNNTKTPFAIAIELQYSANKLHIQGFTQNFCRLIYEKLHIDKMWKLLQFNYQKELSYLPGMSEKGAEILYNNIRRAVGTCLDYEVAEATNLTTITKDKLKRWFRHNLTYEMLIDYEQLTNWIPFQLAVKEAIDLYDFCKQHHNDIAMMYEYFKPMCSKMKYESGNKKELKGMVCLDGSTDKPFYRTKLNNFGWCVQNTVTSDTLYLITDNVNSNTQKNQLAKQNNVEILDIREFDEIA